MAQQIALSTKQAQELETFVQDHMNACYVQLYDEEDVREDWQPYDAYCGCDTCNSRESLMATFDWLRSNDIVDIFVQAK